MSELSLNETAVHQTKLSARGRKAIIAGSIGNTVEWVDWSVYTTFSSVFARHFFPAGNEIASLLIETESARSESAGELLARLQAHLDDEEQRSRFVAATLSRFDPEY